MKIKRTLLSLLLVIALLIPGIGLAAQDNYGSAKNIIVMIPDGMNIESATLARWMTDDFELVMDSMATGLVRTNNASTPIADSAPAGTAMATGIKTESPFVGSYPTSATMPGAEEFEPERAKMPIANVMEAAQTVGKSTGIISTSNVQHATPADFSAHHPNRNNYENLGEQQVYQNLDVVLGAGSRYLEASEREDGEDLIAELKAMGYDYVTDTASMKEASGDKIWGLFAEKSFDYSIDRDPAVEPSLAEMTSKAIDVLAKNDNGFVLMVEGSEIDWAGHANDPVGMVSDILAFDEAVKVAKDFADENGETVIVIASDHGTGGPSIGEYEITKGYDRQPLEAFTHIIKDAKLTGNGVAKALNEDRSNIAEVMADAYGIDDLTEEEIKSIKEADDVQNAVGSIVSMRSHIGWTTGGHVGGDVALYCYVTDENAKVLSGTVHNSDIGKYVADLLGVDMMELTDQLFVKARDAFEAKGATVEFKFESPGNPIIEVKKDDTTLVIPTSKNYLLKNGEKVELDGVVVFNGETVYVPQSAIDEI